MRVLPLKPQADAENLSRFNLSLHTYAVRNSFLTTLVFTPATMSGLLLPRLYVDNSNLLPGAYRRETTAESASSVNPRAARWREPKLLLTLVFRVRGR